MRAWLWVVVAASLLVAASSAAASHGGANTGRCDNLDVSFVMDRSGSMNGAPAIAARDGAVSLVTRLLSTDFSGVRSFPITVDDKSIDNNHAATRAGIEGTPLATGSLTTATQSSYDDLRTAGRPTARQIMIILSDGVNEDVNGITNAAKAFGIEVFSVWIGGDTSGQPLMRSYASTPQSYYYKEAMTTAEAQRAMDEVLQSTMQCLAADFSVTPACQTRLTRFTDTSVPSLNRPIDTARWDFGDGSPPASFTPPSPTVGHAYATPGTYNVTLNVTDVDGFSDAVTIVVVVPPCPPEPPVADFACRGLTDPWLAVDFTDLSTDVNGPIARWEWDFGDGNLSSLQHPRHFFAARGHYQVSLRVWDGDGETGSATRRCIAYLNRPPVINLQPDVTVYEGESVHFTVTATDPDGDVLLYAMLPAGLPSSARFLPSTQVFEWTPVRGMAGDHGPVAFTVSDGFYDDSMSMRIRVLPAPVEGPPGNADEDGDGVPDGTDNCPNLANGAQADADGDRFGDDCDPQPGVPSTVPPATESAPEGSLEGGVPGGPGETSDRDRDGVADSADNCPAVPNPPQGDRDRDGLGDVCDLDLDGDGVAERDVLGRLLDNCPLAFNPDQADGVGDGVGDACRGDADGDGVPDAEDACPWVGGVDAAGCEPAPGPAAAPPAAGSAPARDGLFQGASLRVGLPLLLLAMGGLLAAFLVRRSRDG